VAPTGRTLILDLLSTLHRGTMPVGALVEAGELFGIPGNTARVALARLVAAGHVVRDERGRYRLGEKAAPVERRVRSWRDLDRITRSWTGSWLAVHVAVSTNGRRRRDGRGRERALRLFGFQALEPGLLVRPDNLRAGVDEVRRELRALGLPERDLVFELRALDPQAETRARKLWDVDRLRTAYRNWLRELADSEGRVVALPAERAMVESFLLGREVIRDLVLDPLLPDAICPAAERQALVAALRRYDRLGRAAWAGFLRRFDVPHIRTPLDGPHAAEPERLAV
jgi:phenylacetic acid degradation operon negative regulatory protein